MACREYQARLAELEDYLDGRLAGAAAAGVEAHLGRCVDCRDAVEAARQGTALLREGLEPAPEPSPFFWARLGAHLRAAALPRPAAEFWRSLELLAWRLAWTAAVVLILLGGYTAAFDVARDHNMTAEAESQEIFPQPVERLNDHEEMLVVLANRNGR